MAALIRSLATKIVRAPPRLPYALEHHGRLPTSSGGLSRFSTSSGSTPSSGNLRGPQTHDKEVPSDSEWHRAVDSFKKDATTAAFLVLFGIFAFLNFHANPALERIHADMDAQIKALVAMTEQLDKSNERMRARLRSGMESQD